MGVLGGLIGKVAGLSGKDAGLLALGPGFLAGSKLLAPPPFPKPPAPPNPAQFLAPKAVPSLFSPGGDSSNSTFFGNNRSPQIAGGKKTLLGQ